MDSKPPPKPHHTTSETHIAPSTSQKRKFRASGLPTVPTLDFQRTQWKPFKEILEALQRKYEDNPDPLAPYADRMKTSYSNVSLASVATVMSFDEERTMAEVKRMRDRYFVKGGDSGSATSTALAGGVETLPSNAATPTTTAGIAKRPDASTGATPKIPTTTRRSTISQDGERREFASFFNDSAGRGRRFTLRRFDAGAAAAWAHGGPPEAPDEPVATGNRRYRRSMRYYNLQKHEHPGFNQYFSKTSMSRLLRSLRSGDIRVVREELDIHEMDVNRTINGRFALHYAADYGQYEMLRFLLDNGANVNARDDYGITPLLVCIWEGHTRCVELLLNRGASTDGTTPDGRSYLDEAQKPEIRELLARPSAQTNPAQ